MKIRPVFIKTRNVRNFCVLMDGLELAEGEGRLGLVIGQAGRGKTRTSQWYAANERCIYLRMATVWRTSELDFLRMLCAELGIKDPPHRKGVCFSEIITRMLADPRPVFLDEIEKLPRFFLDVIRDITDMTTAPFVLVGEYELNRYVQSNRRGWSRVYQSIEFEPITLADIHQYAEESAGVRLSAESAEELFKGSQGDFRLMRRDFIALIQIANAKGTDEITPDMAKTAVKSGLIGR